MEIYQASRNCPFLIGFDLRFLCQKRASRVVSILLSQVGKTTYSNRHMPLSRKMWRRYDFGIQEPEDEWMDKWMHTARPFGCVGYTRRHMQARDHLSATAKP